MKTIFINDIPIYFKKLDNTGLIKENYDTFIDGSSGIIPLKLFSRVLIYDANFQTITDLLKKMTKKKFVKIYSITTTLKDYKRVIKNIKKMFNIIKAGGGVVSNNKNQILFIYRLKRWDLPKGKLDKVKSLENVQREKLKKKQKLKLGLVGK